MTAVVLFFTGIRKTTSLSTMLPAITAGTGGTLALRSLFGDGLATRRIRAAAAAIVFNIRGSAAVTTGILISSFGLLQSGSSRGLLVGQLLLQQVDAVFEIGDFRPQARIGLLSLAGRQHEAQQSE